MNKKLVSMLIAVALLFSFVATSCGKTEDTTTSVDSSSTTTVETSMSTSQTTVTGENTNPTGIFNNGNFSWVVDGAETEDTMIEVVNVSDLVVNLSDDFSIPENFSYVVEFNGKIVEGDGTAIGDRSIHAVSDYGIGLNGFGLVPAGTYYIHFYEGDAIIGSLGATVIYKEEKVSLPTIEIIPGEDFASIQMYKDDQYSDALDEPYVGLDGFYFTCFTATVHSEYKLQGTLTHSGKVISAETIIPTDCPLGDICFKNEDGSSFESGIYEVTITGYDGKVFATVKMCLK